MDSGVEWRAAIEALVTEHPMLAGQDLRIDYPVTLPRWPLCKAPRAQSTRQGVPVGRLSIQLRCSNPRWQGAIQVVVVARRTYYAAARALQAGAVVDADAVVSVEADWASLPEDVVTEPEQVLGRVLVRSVAAGTALTLNLVRLTAVIRVGERVRVQMSGANFVVAGEGVAMQSGGSGEQVRVKMGSGQTVTAVVVRQGLVELRVD
jgi:flagella basal body P-ring formation protein FlgA